MDSLTIRGPWLYLQATPMSAHQHRLFQAGMHWLKNHKGGMTLNDPQESMGYALFSIR